MIKTDAILNNRYKIVRELAQGGMGVIYEAHDLTRDVKVALKENLFSQAQLRFAFEQEANLLSSLNHIGLPKVTDHFIEEKSQYLVMEFVSGENLAELLHKTERETKSAFQPHLVLNWADQLLGILHYLHTRPVPVIHRDIKPQNIKLKPDGKVVLLDFGMAKETATSVPGGTAAYAPPEQINRRGTNPRSDLYSLGMTIHHLITGVEPVSSTFRLSDLYGRKPDPLQPANELNPNVPESIANWISWATALDIESRPISAMEMRVTLRPILSGLSIQPSEKLEKTEVASSNNENGFAKTVKQNVNKNILIPQIESLPDNNANIAKPNPVYDSVVGYSEENVLVSLTAALPTTVMSIESEPDESLQFENSLPLRKTETGFPKQDKSSNLLIADYVKAKEERGKSTTVNEKVNYFPFIVTAFGLILIVIFSLISIVIFINGNTPIENAEVNLPTVTNTQPVAECALTFSVNVVSLDGTNKEVSPDYVFSIGDKFNYGIESSCDGYLYLLTKKHDGIVKAIYPKENEYNNGLEKNRTSSFPPINKPIEATDINATTDVIYFIFVKRRDDDLAQYISNIIGDKEVNAGEPPVVSLLERLEMTKASTIKLESSSPKKVSFGGSFPIVFSSTIETANR